MSIQERFERLFKNHVRSGHLRNSNYVSILSNFPFEEAFNQDQINDLLRDKPTLIFKDGSQYRTLSAPHMVSIFLSILELSSIDRVLVLGAKGGFLEAILASICHEVFVLEQYKPIAQQTQQFLKHFNITNCSIYNANPILGLKNEAPFTRILFTGAVDKIPDSLFSQLTEYGILVAPIIEGKEKQSVVQFIKEKKGVNQINYGGVIFQELLYDPIRPERTINTQYKPTKKAFTEKIAELPKVIIEDICFETDQKNIDLDIDKPSYVLKSIVKNDSNEPIEINIKLEMPSLDKEDSLPRKFRLGPHQKIIEDIIIANPHREGEHDLSIIILDKDMYRLAYVRSKVNIKQAKWKKILNMTLNIIGNTSLNINV